jgi:hypothetical protein
MDGVDSDSFHAIHFSGTFNQDAIALSACPFRAFILYWRHTQESTP